jgi:hypothetical protein
METVVKVERQSLSIRGSPVFIVCVAVNGLSCLLEWLDKCSGAEGPRKLLI